MPKSLFYNQDPSVTSEHNTPWLGVFEANNIPPGLNGANISVAGAANVMPNQQGNLYFMPGTDAFRKTHTYTVTRLTRELAQGILVENGDLVPPATLNWQWGGAVPLNINVDAGVEANAYYDRNRKECRYYHVNNPALPLGTMFSADSAEIVSHETGHAILDIQEMRPGWLTSTHPQTLALHEAFGDVMSVSFCLSRTDMVSRLAGLSGGDLHKTTFLTQMGEQFGRYLGLPSSLRNADNDKTITDLRDRTTGRLPTQPHLLSEVFTGAYYDVLVDIHNRHLRETGEDPIKCIMHTSRWMLRVLFKAIKHYSPPANATFENVVDAMKMVVATNTITPSLIDPTAFGTLVDNQFYNKRKIRGTGAEQNNQRVALQELSGCLRVNSEEAISDEDAACFVEQSQPNLSLHSYKRHREAADAERKDETPGRGASSTKRPATSTT